MKRNAIVLLGVILLAGSPIFAQDYTALTDKSVLRWTGKKISGSSHEGVIKLKEGKFTIKDNAFVSGKFVIDMNTMVEGDGSEPEKGARLIGHLKSDDFFSVAKYPEAVLVIKSSTKFDKDQAEVTADLTIKGATHPVKFNVNKLGEAFQATVTFDRSLYDVRFGSGKFFENLGNNAILDMIPLVVTVVAVRK